MKKQNSNYNKLFYKILLSLSVFLGCTYSYNSYALEVSSQTEEALKKYYESLSKQNYQTYVKSVKNQPSSNSSNSYNSKSINHSNIDHPISAFKKESKTYVINNENCWQSAGKHYNVDPWVLFAYAKTESNFNPKAINKANRNKTYDIGLMQINSIWLPKLKKIGITENMLYDACQSIYVAAWIVKENFDKYGDGYDGIVAYNVGNPKRSGIKKTTDNYYNKFMGNYKYLVAKYK